MQKAAFLLCKDVTNEWHSFFAALHIRASVNLTLVLKGTNKNKFRLRSAVVRRPRWHMSNGKSIFTQALRISRKASNHADSVHVFTYLPKQRSFSYSGKFGGSPRTSSRGQKEVVTLVRLFIHTGASINVL